MDGPKKCVGFLSNIIQYLFENDLRLTSELPQVNSKTPSDHQHMSTKCKHYAKMAALSPRKPEKLSFDFSQLAPAFCSGEGDQILFEIKHNTPNK